MNDWIAHIIWRMHQHVLCKLFESSHHQREYIDGLVQERCNSSALAMELHLSYTNPSIWSHENELDMLLTCGFWCIGFHGNCCIGLHGNSVWSVYSLLQGFSYKIGRHAAAACAGTAWVIGICILLLVLWKIKSRFSNTPQNSWETKQWTVYTITTQ